VTPVVTAPPSTAFELNGRAVEVRAEPSGALLYALRNDLASKGTRFGCGLEQCGACRVLIDGVPAFACTTPLGSVAGSRVMTIEGVATAMPELIDAFVRHQAAQCGYCASGILVSAAALLQSNPDPTDTDVRRALDGNLCRCGAHLRMVRAVLDAAEARRG
jgi:nicotinate dehydrogenase subunit A